MSAQQLASNIRTFPLRLENVRSDTVNNVDLSLIKNTSVVGKTLELRLDALNAFNHPLFPRGNSTSTGIITTPTAANFGATVSSTQENYARRVQVSVKFLF